MGWPGNPGGPVERCPRLTARRVHSDGAQTAGPGGQRIYEPGEDEAPPLTRPREVVRTASDSFRHDPLFRRVIAVNVGFLAAFLAIQFLLPIPRVMEPLIAILIYFPMAVGQWRFWRWGELDARTAIAFVQLHRKAFKNLDPIEALENPEVQRGQHFRVPVERPRSLKRAAGRATYVYGISIAMGAIFSTLLLPSSPGQQLPIQVLAQRSTAVAFLTVFSAFLLGWVMAPIWLIEDTGVRYLSRKQQTVERVSRWFLSQLGPVLGVGTIGTFFIVYYIAGFGLIDGIFALLQLSISLYPASLTATYLYQKYREDDAVARVEAGFEKAGIPLYKGVVAALVRLPP
jgi:hypothetical protein